LICIVSWYQEVGIWESCNWLVQLPTSCYCHLSISYVDVFLNCCGCVLFVHGNCICHGLPNALNVRSLACGSI
jgi:hypothetical protein